MNNNLIAGVFNIPTKDHVNTPELINLYEEMLSAYDEQSLDESHPSAIIEHLQKYNSIIKEEDIYFKYFELLDQDGNLTGQYYSGNDYLNVDFRVVFKSAKLSEIAKEIENPNLRAVCFFFQWKHEGVETYHYQLTQFDIVDGVIEENFTDSDVPKKLYQFYPNYVFGKKQIRKIFEKGLTHEDYIKFINIYKVNNPKINLDLTVGWYRWNENFSHEAKEDDLDTLERPLIDSIMEFELKSCNFLQFYCGIGIDFYTEYSNTDTKRWTIHYEF